jgi:hypothetical protein
MANLKHAYRHGKSRHATQERRQSQIIATHLGAWRFRKTILVFLKENHLKREYSSKSDFHLYAET